MKNLAAFYGLGTGPRINHHDHHNWVITGYYGYYSY